MSERLTDEELQQWIDGGNPIIERMGRELQQLRSSPAQGVTLSEAVHYRDRYFQNWIDAEAKAEEMAANCVTLSEEEREAVKQLQWEAKTFLLGGDRYDKSEYERRCKIVKAIAILDRLTRTPK